MKNDDYVYWANFPRCNSLFVKLNIFLLLLQFKGMEICKRSGSSGIMAAVWKFHQDGDDGSF